MATVRHDDARGFSARFGLIGDGLVPQLSRYSAVSALALAVDFALFLSLTAAKLSPVAAGIAGYAAGMLAHYLLSVRYVFDARATQKLHARLFGEFVLSGLAGMATTALVIAMATQLAGLLPLTAKVFAAAASFLLVFSLRRLIVFADITGTAAGVAGRPVG